MIIGITGSNAAGKGEAARFLQGKSYHYLSLSDVLRQELEARGMELTRDNLISLGNELRLHLGPAALAEKILPRIQEGDGQHYVIDSIRNPGEVETLRRLGHFILINIEAPPELRFARIRQRQRQGDPQTLETFLDVERREEAGADPHLQHLSACRQMANHTVVNDGTLEEFHQRLQRLLASLPVSTQRPSWDEYFMNIARVAAQRSNCMKRRVAAVIVKDRRVISTGYNGTPRGTRNCNEGGCPRCNSLATQGTQLEECLCSHGEENAITQAAYHGTAVKDATLYTTYAPCLLCTKMIINAGIREVVYNLNYPLTDTSFRLLQEAGVIIRQCSSGEVGTVT